MDPAEADRIKHSTHLTKYTLRSIHDISRFRERAERKLPVRAAALLFDAGFFDHQVNVGVGIFFALHK
jgi:hypothetical protein